MSYYDEYERESYLERLTRSRITIAGITLNAGDVIEVSIGRNRYVGVFLGFNVGMYCLALRTEDGDNMIIPYKSIKYIRKYNQREQKQDTQQ